MNRNKTVLVISDGHEQFALAASLLQNDGYCVLFENDMSHGLQRAQAEPPQLIISELAVPNVDGLELCCRVRDDRKLESTPILLVGDLSKQSTIVADGLRCGASDYLQKPIDQFKLFDLCRGVVRPEENGLPYRRNEKSFSLRGKDDNTDFPKPVFPVPHEELATLSFDCWEIDSELICKN